MSTIETVPPNATTNVAEAATTSEQDYVDVDITHLSQELFGESVDKLDPESMEAPKNPVAQQTADKVKKDYDAILFAKMVFDLLIKVKEQNLTEEEGCVRVAKYWEDLSPSTQHKLVSIFPFLMKSRSSSGSGGSLQDSGAVKTDLDLRALSNEMFGVEIEKVRENALDNPQNSVTERTKQETASYGPARDFAEMANIYMINVANGDFSEEGASQELKEHFQRLPPNIQDMLVEMYPSLKPIRFNLAEGPAKTSKDAVAAKNYLDLRALSNEMFGVEMEKLKDNALDNPQNFVTEKTKQDTAPYGSARDFAEMANSYIVNVANGDFSEEGASQELKKQFQSLPPNIQDMLTKLYPALEPIHSTTKYSSDVAIPPEDSQLPPVAIPPEDSNLPPVAIPPEDSKVPPPAQGNKDVADIGLLDCLSEEMFGKEADKVNSRMLHQPDNGVAKCTMRATEEDRHATDFVREVLISIKRMNAGRHSRGQAVNAIRRSFTRSPSKKFLTERFKTLEALMISVSGQPNRSTSC
ncbi:hypothetical protein V3C99_013513 [Haemonchus contortus]